MMRTGTRTPRTLNWIGVGAALALSFLLAAPALAIQHTPTGTALIHTDTSGQPGVQWNTGGLGAGGQISYSSGLNELSVTGVVDVLNYFDPLNGSCPTDAGSNCSFNFGPDLVLNAEMEIDSITVTGPVFGTTVQVDIQLSGTADGNADLTWTDPTDNTVVLSADWTAGIFNGNPVNGVTASIFYDTFTGVASFNTGLVPQTGFLAIDAGSPYASLFDSGTGLFGIDISTLSDFVGAGGGLNEIVGHAVANGSLPDFTAEGNGQTYRLATGDFVVPEPGTGLLVGLGLAMMARRRNKG